MGATVYYLIRMVNGDSKDGAFQQRMMRGRVGSQAFTIVVMCASGMWASHRFNQEQLEKRARKRELEEQQGKSAAAVPS